MKEDKLIYDVQKRARAGTSATARAAVALYLIWLGVRIIRSVMNGSAQMPIAVGWAFGLLFIGAAVAFGFYIWRRWRTDVEAARLTELSHEESSED